MTFFRKVELQDNANAGSGRFASGGTVNGTVKPYVSNSHRIIEEGIDSFRFGPCYFNPICLHISAAMVSGLVPLGMRTKSLPAFLASCANSSECL